ncbi:MAG: hypothetical protein LCH67_03065 [Bacteroidetes bacterium]|nr:hypothetical protein [Bacteroidota bacterium]
MKIVKKVLLLFFLFVWLSSCEKEEVKNEVFLSCKINGVAYKVTGETATYATLKTADTYWIYGIDAATGKEMYVRVGVNQGVGTVQMKGTTQASFVDADKTNYHTNFNSGSGEITLTEKTATTLKGKFSFIANTFSAPIKKATVTEGEFNVLIK